LTSSLKRALTTRGWASWLALVVLFPLSVYAWAPDRLFESWYGPIHVVWAIACGAALYASRADAPPSAAGEAPTERRPPERPVVAPRSGALWTVGLIVCVYLVAALVGWRTESWGLHPQLMPGPASGYPRLALLDGAVFAGAAATLGVLWFRAMSRGLEGGRDHSSEGGSPC
jgi:hypothetical protein